MNYKLNTFWSKSIKAMTLPILLSMGLILLFSPSTSFAQMMDKDCMDPTWDTDKDGTPDCEDWCPLDPNKTEPNVCGCGVEDDLGDPDGDGVLNCEDVCPNNPEKTDEEGPCGCDATLEEDNTDSDGDGTPDCMDQCPMNPNTTMPGACNDCDAPGIVSVSLSEQTDCDDNGTTQKGDDTFTADVTVTFNFAPRLGAIRIKGGLSARFDFKNNNTSSSITIKEQTFKADGNPINLVVEYIGNEMCDFETSLPGSGPCSAAPCAAPGFVNADVGGDDDVFVTWGTNPSDIGYEYRYRALVGGAFRGATTTLPMVTICELGMNKAFIFEVRSLCCESDWSDWTPVFFETGDNMVDCKQAPDPSLGCIYAITIDNIFDCYDGGTRYKTSDDYLDAIVTIHFTERPAKGVLEITGMANKVINLGKVFGNSHSVRLRLNYRSSNSLTAVFADFPASHGRFCPVIQACSFTDSRVFICDPCSPSSLDAFGEIFGKLGPVAKAMDLGNTALTTQAANTFQAEMTLFPNPAQEQLFIALNGEVSGDVNISVYDMAGKLQITQSLEYGYDNIPINISALSNGIYMVQLENNGQIQTGRVIKSK